LTLLCPFFFIKIGGILMENPFVKLFAIDFKDHLEVKKSGNTELKYVSWAYDFKAKNPGIPWHVSGRR